jgi:hypothetical protein
MYRARLSRGLPSIDHLELMPKKYLPLLRSTIVLETNGPVYSTIRLPLGIGLRVTNPNPLEVLLTLKR